MEQIAPPSNPAKLIDNGLLGRGKGDLVFLEQERSQIQ
jgi:hypothetical protein